MRKRIREIARGKFEYDQPSLSISEEKLSFTVTEGQEYTGEFEISSTNHIPVRGVVYSSSSRMECLTPQFEGERVRIRYQFHSRGLVEGEEEKGELTIVYNQGVTSLPFCVSVSRLYAESSMGQIRSLNDFTALARENWKEAYQLFYHKNFSHLFKTKEIREEMIYRGILAAKPSPQNMEEFLIAVEKKNPIRFTLSGDDSVPGDILETQQQEVEIRKSEWGYIRIQIETDADFIRLSDNQITSEDFLGSTCSFKYLIDYDRMHAGNNYARITFSSVYETRVLEISAHKGEKKVSEKHRERMQIKEYQAGLVELYEAYRLKKIVTGAWSNETVEILDHLHAMVPEEPMYVLMKAQALLINRQRQEAEWILDEFKHTFSDRHSPEWGYYLYILTLMEREPAYVDRMTHEIELIFRENPDSALLFWVLSFLEEEYYNNSAHKLRAIAYWVKNGCTSPYLYVEAYYIIWQEPYLMTSLTGFEINILRWAIRHQALTREIAAQIFEVVDLNSGYDEISYQLMCEAYEADETEEHLGFICSYLIRAQRFDVRFHHWFESGIEKKLRITGLYEAYLLSLDEREIGKVPKIIRMYFQYDSNLPYRKMAILYNNIIASKKREPEIYEQYHKVMSRFAMEQIEKEHMDDNLAVVYEDLLDLGLINEELAHRLSGILFTRKLILFDKRMVRAIIYQKQMKEPQIVPIVDRAAYFQLFSDEYVILFEDERGRRYVKSVSYRLESLMEADRYLDKCMALAPDEIPYIVYHFLGKNSYLDFLEEDEVFFEPVLFSGKLSDRYQTEMALEILRFYQAKSEETMVGQYLERADFSVMSQPVCQYMLDLLVDWKMYDRAYELMQIYGMDQMGAAAKVTLASHRIDEISEDEEDEYLILLCVDAFSHKKYNDRILQYLSLYYNGPSEMMMRLWSAARSFECKTFELEERILVQMLYTDADLTGLSEVFAHYYDSGGRELVVLAYISASAHAYFLQNKAASRDVTDIIRYRYLHHMELNDACKLALLKSLSEQPLSDKNYEIEDELLAEYTCRNMNFAFYKKLDKRLVKKYHLYDKVFLEYRTDPRKHVILHYSRDEDGQNFIQEDMPDIYDGIFVEQFVLFFGEVVQYYITEEYKNKVESTESSRLTSNDVYGQKDVSRYNLINQMLISGTLSDDESLFYHMKQYAGLDEVTKNVFKLL